MKEILVFHLYEDEIIKEDEVLKISTKVKIIIGVVKERYLDFFNEVKD